jgi:hypothetical protein
VGGIATIDAATVFDRAKVSFEWGKDMDGDDKAVAVGYDPPCLFAGY